MASQGAGPGGGGQRARRGRARGPVRTGGHAGVGEGHETALAAAPRPQASGSVGTQRPVDGRGCRQVGATAKMAAAGTHMRPSLPHGLWASGVVGAPRAHRAGGLRPGQQGDHLQARALVAHTLQPRHHLRVPPPLAGLPVQRHNVVALPQSGRLQGHGAVESAARAPVPLPTVPSAPSSQAASAHPRNLAPRVGQGPYRGRAPGDDSGDEDRRVSTQREAEASLSAGHVDRPHQPPAVLG